MALRELWNKYTTHPMWSNVIGTLIAAGIIGTAALTWSGLRAVALSPSTGEMTSQAWHWLWAPVPTRRLLLLLANFANGLLLGVAAWMWLIARRELVIKRVAISKLEQVRDIAREALRGPAPPSEVPPLDDRQTRALHILYVELPGSVALRQLAGNIGLSYGRAEQLFERLQELQLVRVVPNDWHGAQVKLTTRGRDLCIERGIAQR